MRQIHIILIALLVGTILGCKPSFIISDQNYQEHTFQIASADNDYVLDMPTVYDMLYKSKTLELGGVMDTGLVRDFIDSLVLDSIVGFAAYDVNLSDHYQKRRVFKIRYYEALIKEYFNKMVYEKSIADSLEVVEYYNNNDNLFAVEEQVNISHIALSENTLLKSADSIRYAQLSKDELQVELLRVADSIKALITSPEKFPEIASKFSEDLEGAKTGGYLGWTKRNAYPHPFDSIAFELRDGQIGGPYQDPQGIHIIMVSNYAPAGLPEMDERGYLTAKKTLETMNSNRIGMKLLDSLFADIIVLVNPEIADADIFSFDGKLWGAIINGIDTIECNDIRMMETKARGRYGVKSSDVKMKTDMFRTLGKKYAIIQAARNVGIEELPNITEVRNRLIHKYARTVVIERKFDVRWTPSQEALENYYADHIDDFKIDKPLKVQHIIAEDSVFGEFLRDQAMSGIDFMELAKEHYPGEESIREELADLGFISENDVSKDFYETALHTRKGEVSHPVKTEFGYHIIKVLDIKYSLTFDEARRVMLPILKKEYKENSLSIFRKELFSKYNVKYKGRLYQVHLKPKALRE